MVGEAMETSVGYVLMSKCLNEKTIIMVKLFMYETKTI